MQEEEKTTRGPRWSWAEQGDGPSDYDCIEDGSENEQPLHKRADVRTTKLILKIPGAPRWTHKPC